MSERNGSPIGHEVVEQIINKRIKDARKAEVLLIYEDLLQAVWDRILPTLGRVTTIAIMERAIVLTKEHYPIIPDCPLAIFHGFEASCEPSPRR